MDGEAAIRADTPRQAARTWTSRPVSRPSTAATPAVRPRSSRWVTAYRTDGPGSRRLQRGGFSSERDAAEALERALERLRRQKGVGSMLTLFFNGDPVTDSESAARSDTKRFAAYFWGLIERGNY